MKRFLILPFFIGSLSVYSQMTQADLDALQKKLQKQRDSVMNLPHVKEHMNKSKSGSVDFPVSKTNNNLPPNSRSDKNIEKFTLPPKDSVKISSIPKKNFSLAELQSYLDQLYLQLTKKYSADVIGSVNSIAAKLGNHPDKMEATALTAWQNGSGTEALLLIVKAATANAADGLLLSNSGAMLDMSGMSEKTIPILRTVLQYDRENVIALNNLGQAYTAIGLQDSAMIYLNHCISLSPNHPEANNTAGYIELQKGNKGKAQKHFESSIYGSFNISAYTGLKSILKEKTRIAKLIRPKVKMPEYFNQFRYKLPVQPTDVKEVLKLKEEQKIFREVISSSIRMYEKLGKEAEKSFAANGGFQHMNQTIQKKVLAGEPYMKPFQVLAGIMEAETMLEYEDDRKDLEIFNTKSRSEYKQLEQAYEKEYNVLLKKFDDEDEDCCGEGDVSCCPNAEAFCREANELKNKYLEKFAVIINEWQNRNLNMELKHFDNLIYWSYFSAWDVDDYRVRFYQKLVNYLKALQRLSELKFLEPCMENDAGEIEGTEKKELKEFDCPFDVEIPFIVGKLTMSCEKFSFKAGEGLVFKLQKNFTGDRQTTISLGAGGGIDASFKLGGVKAGIETGMDMSVYLSFDKIGHCIDGGMSYKASRGMGIDFSAGERLKIKKQIGYVGEELGWRFGINSGIKFSVPFKEYPGVPPTGSNKNLPNFQQN